MEVAMNKRLALFAAALLAATVSNTPAHANKGLTAAVGHTFRENLKKQIRDCVNRPRLCENGFVVFPDPERGSTKALRLRDADVEKGKLTFLVKNLKSVLAHPNPELLVLAIITPKNNEEWPWYRRQHRQLLRALR
jgi:hypothetical protein